MNDQVNAPVPLGEDGDIEKLRALSDAIPGGPWEAVNTAVSHASGEGPCMAIGYTFRVAELIAGSVNYVRAVLLARPTMPDDQHSSALTQPAASGEVAQHGVVKAGVRDGDNEWHIECRFADGQKFAAVIVDHECEALAHAIADFLSATPQPDADTVRDAERYRGWRLLAVTGTMSNWACERLIHARTETDIDAAIDSAIKGEK